MSVVCVWFSPWLIVSYQWETDLHLARWRIVIGRPHIHRQVPVFDPGYDDSVPWAWKD